ncbi:MAG: DUF5670 family protein [Crocinitomicaceae bacterium]
MKNTLQIISLAIISSLLLFSCGTSKSFNKSRYNNNYYIGMSKKENVNNISSNSALQQTDPEVRTESKTPQKEEPSVDVNKESDITTGPLVTEVELDQIKNQKIATNETSSKEEIEKTNSRDRNSKVHKIIKDKYEKIQENASQNNRSGDALSLLWIIILVLLILWALGWGFGGFGLGGLIHVLAVIALILLILWLLRVI